MALLGREGARAVIDSTIGRRSDPVPFRPDEAGYLAFVAPTPTLLVVHTRDGSLAGVTFIARPSLNGSAAVLLLPADLLLAPPAGSEPAGGADGSDPAEGADGSEPAAGAEQAGGADRALTLAEAYSSDGAVGVERLAEGLFGFGFEEVIEMTTADLAAAMTPAAPLDFALADDLVAIDGDGGARVVHPSGRRPLGAAAAADVYGHRNPGEADADRVGRQRSMWESWLDSIGRADDPSAAVLAFDTGLSPFLEARGAGAASVEAAPLRPTAATEESGPLYALEAEGRSWVRARASELVPWPTAPRSFWRPIVQLLDGTRDSALRDRSARKVIAAGGIVTVMGNAGQFGQEETLVAYHRPAAMSAAEDLSVALQSGGRAAGMAFVERPADAEYVVDITVTVGLDLAAP